MDDVCNEFFIIDSDNLNQIKTKFYGYGIIEDELTVFNPGSDYDNLSKIGAYVYVDVDGDKITISQDYIGSYGLYYYRDDDYFALSNSFLRLMEYLRDTKRIITLNERYADYYLGLRLSANSFSYTLINEIEMLARDIDVVIDKNLKTIEFRAIEFDEHTVSINTKEALDILDNWFYRWVDIIRNLRSATNDIIVDISGGMDSRLVACIWLNADIDLDNIKINSANTLRFKEDWEIALKIAEAFNLKLNNDLNFKRALIDPKDALIWSEYVKFGFEKQKFIRGSVPVTPLFRISGHCGETLRDYINQTPSQYIDDSINKINQLSPELTQSSRELLEDEFNNLIERFGFEDENSKEISAMLYSLARNRNHFGKEFTDSIFFNKFTIAPLSDPDLQKINFKIGIDDNYLLYALIFKRFCPELLDFEFSGGRKYSQKTLDACDDINKIKEFKPKEYDFIKGPEVKEIDNSDISFKDDDFTFIKDLFNSCDFQKEFEKYYSAELYTKIRLNLAKGRRNIFDIISAIEIIKTIDDVKKSSLTDSPDFIEWVGSFSKKPNDANKIKASSLAQIYSKARIDIINEGSENNLIEVYETSDELCKITFPDWFSSKKGRGCVIESTNYSLNFKVRIIKDGLLNIKLRGPNAQDMNKNRFPVYIDYTKFAISDDDILNESRLLSHDDSYVFTMDVKDTQELDIRIEWMPFSNSSLYMNKKINELEDKIKKLEDENRHLRNNAKENTDSRSFNLFSKLKKN